MERLARGARKKFLAVLAVVMQFPHLFLASTQSEESGAWKRAQNTSRSARRLCNDWI
jgi:hypothetical protein